MLTPERRAELVAAIRAAGAVDVAPGDRVAAHIDALCSLLVEVHAERHRRAFVHDVADTARAAVDRLWLTIARELVEPRDGPNP